VLAEAAEADGGEVDPVDQDLAAGGGMEAADERDDGGLAGAGGAYESGDGSGFGVEADAVENGLVGLVAESDVFEGDVALDRGQNDGAVGLACPLRVSLRISVVRSRPASASVSWVADGDEFGPRAPP